jgi:hypothetical protein
MPRDSSIEAIVIPIVFTVRAMMGGENVAMGSANGGSQIRVGKGELW